MIANEQARVVAPKDELLALVVQSLTDGVVVVGPRQEVLVINSEAERILGISPAQATGRTIDDIATTWRLRDRGAYAVSKMRHHLQRGEPYRNDAAFAVADTGETLDVSLVLKPIRLSDAGPGAVITVRDVTAARAAEQQLRSSDEQSRAAFRMAPTGLVRLDLHGCIAASNEAFSSMLGRDELSLAGVELADLVHADDEERTREVLPLVLRGEEHLWQGELRWWGARGTVWTSTALALVRAGNRQQDFAMCVVEDLTERRRLELELRHAQKLESVGRLSAGIAHEINTPIQFVADNLRFLGDAFDTMRGALAASRREPVTLARDAGAVTNEDDLAFLEDEVPRAVSQSMEGVERVAAIVRAMKTFGDEGGGERTLTDLNEAVLNTIEIARPETAAVADVVADLGDIPPVGCHRGEFNQCVLSLLVNAADAIAEVAPQRGRGLITVRSWCEEDHAVVAIGDSGGGVSESISDRIFDPFFTTKEVGRGTGLGLALARAVVVDRHGGALTFESGPGSGSTFFIRLPVEAAGHAQWPLGSDPATERR